MKRKVKRYDGGGYGRFVEESPKSIEDMKTGLAAGAPAADESDTYAPKTRTFSTTGPEKPKPKPRPRPAAKADEESSLSNMEDAGRVMRRGLAGPSDSGRNPSLDRLMSDREATASREARRKAAMVDKAKAGVPETGTRADAVAKQFSDAADKRKSEAQDERKLNRRRSELGDAVVGKINQVGQYALDKILGKKKGGSVKSASARADGCAIRGKTRA